MTSTKQILEDISKHGSWQRVEYWLRKYGIRKGECVNERQ